MLANTNGATKIFCDKHEEFVLCPSSFVDSMQRTKDKGQRTKNYCRNSL